MPLTNFADKVTSITHTWLNKIDVLYVTVFGEATTKAEARTALGSTATGDAVFVAATSNAALTALTATRAETGAVAVPVLTKHREIITAEDFGAVGDGATDDLTPLTNFINALLSGTNLEGRFLKKIYAVSAALPNITVSNVRLVGYRAASHDVGVFTGTMIKKIGAASGTILTIAPTEGASAQRLTGIGLLGIGFDCNSLAAKGLVVKSVSHSDIDVTVFNATTTGFELNVATTLGEAADNQYNKIRYYGRQLESAGISLRLIGNASANTSLNVFEMVDIAHKNSIGIISENADNNLWEMVRVLQAAGGTAVNSIEWRGGATEAESTRHEVFKVLSTTLAAIAKGTGTYTVGAGSIFILDLDKGNSTPTPTEETGTTIYDNEWRTYTFTPTATSGTFTTVSGAGRYQRLRRSMRVSQTVTITTNGTASGAVRAPLPVVSGSGAGTQNLTGIETAVTGITQRGLITQGSSNCDITDYAGVYSGGTGRTITMNGEYETS